MTPLADLLALPGSVDYTSDAELNAILKNEQLQFEKVLALPFSQLTDGDVEEIRIRFSGKKSPLQNLLRSLKVLPPESRKGAGAGINELKSLIESKLEAYLSSYYKAAEEQKLARERDDLTLPLPEVNVGSRHPVPSVLSELQEAFRRLGFAVIDGPEIELDFYNFEALNIAKQHPAREMQDTFFLSSEWVLRTHTSNVQIHAMLERGVPLRVVSGGFTYRNEYDLTHVPAFRQMECLVVDKGIHMGHLRHTLDMFFKEIFGRPVKMRLRASYFPFTEPSAEVDVECQQCFGKGCRSCKGTGWLEMGGCGLVNRKVFEHCNIDPDVYSGFAFGMGIDRIALIKYAVPDLRSMFEGDVSYLKEFRL